MAAPPPPPPSAASKGVLSLYDNLIDPNDKSATISSAPVRYDQQPGSDASAATTASVKKPLDPALRFQPIRRPQTKTTKPKAASKPTSQPIPSIATQQPPPPQEAASTTAAAPPPPPKNSLADWAATEDDEWRYGMGEKRQRGGRKKKKKHHVQLETDWDDIYDPTRPTNVDEFLRSDERIDEVREWKALLYRHRTSRKRESDLSDDSEEDSRPVASNQFAPPSSYNFAPPPQSPPAPPPESLPPPPPEDNNTSTISAAPIRYSQPPARNDDQDVDRYSPPPALKGSPSAGPPSTSLPGQAGFAQRLMSKYGWTSGTGLGASSSGIINPLHVKVEKRKKRADADGGGWADPANKGRILGGQRAAPATGDETSSADRGKMSEVIVLENMLENMPDLQEEISAGLGQEIGEECGEKYGRVERLYIDQTRRLVFIKFTDSISALRAVTELDGRVFNGNPILPKYYDTEKFEQGIYG